MHLARFPRVSLGHFPTPLEPLDNLSKLLGGPKIWIKRDDATGLASGGNKTRKLEFLLADALAKNADVVITQGATQSNHVRQTIAGAARLGLQAKALLEQRVTDFGEDYQRSGNVLLDELLGGEIVAHLPGGSDMQQAMEEYAATLREQGHTPYIIPGGGSNPIGALGYVACAEELLYSVISATPAHRSRGSRHGQHRYSGRAGGGLYGDQQPRSGAGHQRACAEGEAGRERLASGGENAQPAGRGGRATAQRRGSQ